MHHFKSYSLHRFVSSHALLTFFLTILFFSCKKEDEKDVDNHTPATEITVSLFGSVSDENGMPLPGVTLKAGITTISSDANGLFLLENVKVPKGRYYVSATKPGYFESGRGGLAKEGERYSINIILLSRGTALNLNAATGGVLNTAGNSSLDFPAGAIVTASGQAYTGNVKVYTQYLSPGDPAFAERVPGGDLAFRNNNGELSPLVSFGMMGVELEDNSGNPLKIATGKTVSVRFPIAASQQATSAASIPLLSFDAEAGVWIQEGNATRIGNFYEGTVSHFSWWNCDVIIDPPAPTIIGTVVDCNGDSLAGVTVTVNGQFTLITNAQGQYSSWIPPGTHTFQVLSSNNGGILSSNPVTLTVSSGNATVPVLTVPCPAYITAQAIDCNGNNIAAAGRAIWSGGNSPVQFSPNGSFQFAVPANQSITIQLFNGQANANTNVTSGNLNTTVPAGAITLCNQGGAGSCAGGPSTVTDVDGNVYNVVTIGNQCWMKENLKTTKYRNGNPIPGNLVDSAWFLTTNGAQADYDNDPANTVVYGKLYNWYAVADPAGLCPTGWHVPSDAEWNQLVKFLDSGADTTVDGIQSTIAGGLLKTSGTLQAGSGLWEAPNTDASNLSGFSGLPGGWQRFGTSNDLGYDSFFWSSTDNMTTHAWYRNLFHLDGSIIRSYFDSRHGLSVRCIRD